MENYEKLLWLGCFPSRAIDNGSDRSEREIRQRRKLSSLNLSQHEDRFLGNSPSLSVAPFKLLRSSKKSRHSYTFISMTFKVSFYGRLLARALARLKRECWASLRRNRTQQPEPWPRQRQAALSFARDEKLCDVWISNEHWSERGTANESEPGELSPIQQVVDVSTLRVHGRC